LHNNKKKKMTEKEIEIEQKKEKEEDGGFGSRILEFGKHKGSHIRDLPLRYAAAIAGCNMGDDSSVTKDGYSLIVSNIWKRVKEKNQFTKLFPRSFWTDVAILETSQDQLHFLHGYIDAMLEDCIIDQVEYDMITAFCAFKDSIEDCKNHLIMKREKKCIFCENDLFQIEGCGVKSFYCHIACWIMINYRREQNIAQRNRILSIQDEEQGVTNFIF
jgi:hypothetical protein